MVSVPVKRALSFQYIFANKSICINDNELIVGERGPAPKACPTYPEICIHSLEDLQILNDREKTSYAVGADVARVYEEEVIPYWSGRSLRDRIFQELLQEWHDAYAAGIFTEFMEQRAPGHTVADGKIYRKGMLDLKEEIAESLAGLDLSDDPAGSQKREQLKAMEIAADVTVLLTFGLDPEGFFIEPDASEPEFLIDNLRISGNAAATGSFGFLGVELGDLSLELEENLEVFEEIWNEIGKRLKKSDKE